MSNEETLDMLNDWANGTITMISDKCLSNAIVAIDKQVAKSRIIKEGKYYCCRCERFAKSSGYCNYCGQLLY